MAKKITLLFAICSLTACNQRIGQDPGTTPELKREAITVDYVQENREKGQLLCAGVGGEAREFRPSDGMDATAAFYTLKDHKLVIFIPIHQSGGTAHYEAYYNQAYAHCRTPAVPTPAQP